MDFFQVFFVVLTIALLLWLINQFTNLPDKAKSIFFTVVVIITVLWVMYIWGVFRFLGSIFN
jgi:bacteriorhodopsin